MGTKQRLSELEADYVYARGVYCYLVNNTKLKRFVKRRMSKRRRLKVKMQLRRDEICGL